ncbi:MAG: hypothetical protein RJB01_111 [Actinomycetota bacterium]|jgi:hypothetical protein
MKRIAALAATGLLAATALAGCSSDESTSEEPMVGGMTECTQEILAEQAIAYAESLSPDNTFTTDSVDCADGWAVANGILGPKDAPADGPQGAPTALIFQQEGQFWIPKDPADVCGTYSDGTYPSDAEIPEALYSACLV